VGSPFSAIRGARPGALPSMCNSIQTILGLWLHCGWSEFFSSLSFGESARGSGFTVFKVRSLISTGAAIK